MKKLLLQCMLALPVLVSAQTNFEGVINYEGYSTMDSGQFFLTISYGKSWMKIERRMDDKLSRHQTSIIINLQDGHQYTIDSLEETVELDSLKYRDVEDLAIEFLPTQTTKNILNQPIRLYNAKALIEDSLALVPENMFAVWFSEGIKFIVPEPYRNKRSLLTTADGNSIWLEFSIFIRSPIAPGQWVVDTVVSRAISIEQRMLANSVFSLPTNFSYRLRYHDPLEETAPVNDKADQMKNPTPKSSKPSKPPPKKGKESKPVKG